MEKETESTIKKLFEKEEEDKKRRELERQKEEEEREKFVQESNKVFNEIIKPKMEEFGEFLSNQGKKIKIDETSGLRFEYGEGYQGEAHLEFTSSRWIKKIMISSTQNIDYQHPNNDYDISEITESFVENKLLEMMKSHIAKRTR